MWGPHNDTCHRTGAAASELNELLYVIFPWLILLVLLHVLFCFGFCICIWMWWNVYFCFACRSCAFAFSSAAASWCSVLLLVFLIMPLFWLLCLHLLVMPWHLRLVLLLPDLLLVFSLCCSFPMFWGGSCALCCLCSVLLCCLCSVLLLLSLIIPLCWLLVLHQFVLSWHLLLLLLLPWHLLLLLLLPELFSKGFCFVLSSWCSAVQPVPAIFLEVQLFRIVCIISK